MRSETPRLAARSGNCIDRRFYFNILGDTYIIRDIIPHPKK
jgi:hypothetical protein